MHDDIDDSDARRSGGTGTGTRTHRLVAVTVAVLAVLVVVVAAATTVTALGTPPAEAAGGSLPAELQADETDGVTVADAPPGTVFGTLLLGGSPDESARIGLIKRGESGGLLYNPSTALVRLSPGDVVVARDGTGYRVTSAQELAGSAGFVGPGATVFQGEENTRTVGFTGESLVGLPREGAGGLSLDRNQTVPASQAVGVYADSSGNRLTVQQPRTSSLQVLNSNGRTVAPGGIVRTSEFVIVRADANFLAAGRAAITLAEAGGGATIRSGIVNRSQAIQRFPSRADVIANIVPPGAADTEFFDPTVRSLANPANAPAGAVYLIQDLRQVRQPGDYVYEVAPDDTDPFGDLLEADPGRVQALRLEASSSPVLDLLRLDDTARQGELVNYQIERSSVGNVHAVSIPADTLRRGVPAGEVRVANLTGVFRKAGTGGTVRGVLLDDGTVVLDDGRRVVDGNVTENASRSVEGRSVRQIFTLVRIDNSGLGTNVLDSGLLAARTVEMRLYEGVPDALRAIGVYQEGDGGNSIDRLSLRVVQAR